MDAQPLSSEDAMIAIAAAALTKKHLFICFPVFLNFI
jgi:hypothetical protein